MSSTNGEFMRMLDDVTHLAKTLISWWVMLIWFLAVGAPYLIYASARDMMFRSIYPNSVWIVELNPAISMGYVEGGRPLIDGHGKGSPSQTYYARVGSVRAAEEWLLDNGYRKTKIYTERVSSGPRSNEKDFPIRHVDDTKMYSIVALLIDHGDGRIHVAPFTYPAGQSPINFRRFKEETFEATGGRDNTALPRMPWLSSDGSGREVQTNYIPPDYIEEYVAACNKPPR